MQTVSDSGSGFEVVVEGEQVVMTFFGHPNIWLRCDAHTATVIATRMLCAVTQLNATAQGAEAEPARVLRLVPKEGA